MKSPHLALPPRTILDTLGTFGDWRLDVYKITPRKERGKFIHAKLWAREIENVPGCAAAFYLCIGDNGWEPRSGPSALQWRRLWGLDPAMKEWAREKMRRYAGVEEREEREENRGETSVREQVLGPKTWDEMTPEQRSAAIMAECKRLGERKAKGKGPSAIQKVVEECFDTFKVPQEKRGGYLHDAVWGWIQESQAKALGYVNFEQYMKSRNDD